MQRLLVSLGAAALLLQSAFAETDYPLGPDSKPQDGVPKGELIKFQFDASKIFPGTTREVTIYVPRQYDPAKPACVYVNQDGVQWNAPTVFDNLIAKAELPVIIGVFVMHGRVPALEAEKALDRFNRSLEYDGLGADYARFLLEELLPAVEAKTTADGRAIRLRKSGNDRCIGGSSSGAIAAWTAAWERPDAFSRVFSTIGTYVSLRGGDRYPGLIRKYEPKPLRIYLQGGSNDLNIYGGDWWMANQSMQRALAFAGYEHAFEWGDGGHNGKHGTALFPDAMRFLWKGWPAPIKPGEGSPQLKDILLPGEAWELVGEGYKFTEGPASNAKGEVFFNDVGANKTYRIGADGKPAIFVQESGGGDGQAFGADGRLYAVASREQKIVAYSPDATMNPIADGFRGNDLVALSNGNLYVTEPGWDGTKPSNIWLIKPGGEKSVVDTGLRFSNGLTVSPDQSLLYVSDSRTHWVYSYAIQPDGTLRHKQRYYWLHTPDTAGDSGADGMEVDRDGRLYVATRLGLQICDQAGRVNCIVPTPNGTVSNIVFGGPAFDTLYVTAGDKVFKRKVKTRGAPSFQPSIKPKPPGL